MVKNKLVIYKDYAEVILENNQHEECARVKISIEDIPVVEAYEDFNSFAHRESAGYRVECDLGLGIR